MKNVVACAIFFVFFGAAVAPVLAQPALLLPGDEYTASDLPANAGGNWFVLARGEDSHVLEELPVAIETLHDACLDDSPEQRSGRSVRVPDADHAVMLVRGVDGLVLGSVVSATYPDRDSHKFDDALSLAWSNKRLALRPVRVGDGFRVELVDAQQVDVLYTTDWTDEGSWALRWAGDLNGDGVVDVLLDATHKYSVFTTRLFLSRKDRDGHSYEEVATLTTTAC